MTELASAALRYAERGWPVFPCNGKRPLVERGLHEATTDPDTVKGWWARWPDANVAVRTGTPSGLVVVDVDGDEGGDTLRQLEAEHAQLPATASVKTPRGGQHFYFRHPGSEIHNSAGQLGPALDVRGDGGYVLAPPSAGPAGRRYEPDEQAPVAPCPNWLLEQMRNGRNGRGPVPPIGDQIPEGERNQQLASLGGSMRRRGMGEREILAALQATNAERCKPPLPHDELERIAASVARYEPATSVTPPAANDRDGVRARPFSTIDPEPVEWLWPDRVPLAMMTLLVGDPGLGKSLLTCDMAARASRAGASVLMLTAEDSPAVTVRPRLEAARADLDRVSVVEAYSDGAPTGLALPDDVPALERLVAEHAARLLVVDPLMAHLPAQVNSWRDQSVRGALAPLHRLACEHGCAVVVVAHLNKSGGADPLHRTGGSIGIPAAARSALLLARDPEDPDESGTGRVLAHAKCNVGPLAASLAYEVETAPVGEVTTARLRYRGESGTNAHGLLAQANAEERTERGDALDFLRTELAEGPRPAKELKGSARDAGIAERTLTRAKAELGVVSERVGGAGSAGHWQWSLRVPTPPDTLSNRKADTLSANPHRERDSAADGSKGGHQTDMASLGAEAPSKPAPRCSCFRPGEVMSDGRCGRCFGTVSEYLETKGGEPHEG